MSLTPRERSRAARIGAYVMHSKHDTRQVSLPGRLAAMARFEREVDPTGELPIEERKRRAEMAKKAHYARIGHLGGKSRKRKTRPMPAPVTTAATRRPAPAATSK